MGAGDGLSDGEGVVATFFLIRYQSVVASRREINFARQFFRISLFIFAVQQNFRDSLPERFRCEIALDSTPMANGNTACLFRDDYRHGIRFLGNPKPCAMTQSQAAIQCFALTHRKNAGRSCDSSITNNHSAIVQRGLWMEDSEN